ncbi:RrF2 family transcriptional regulator [Jeotgalibacillus proteolyticus]|uniref:HTH-type transcriptional regulator NsrR n=1 Tax=Jeotgalibacillus proteolyticus TaxID=2082395 RepID=A0A2S5GCW9_9BACL|nr:Rrf2 family transcriptional regulator [Jeotgalibacillus proteolyticus]PPA70798.1 Rrf2 family transcriptional regulator [Jeotgalibacillus proteolyticus]
MKLTLYTDYSLRVLIYLAAKRENELSTIQEIAGAYQISKNHLVKVTHELGKMSLIETVRGRNGGIRLAKDTAEINIGAVVRKTEEDFHLVECFDPKSNQCVISPVCGLKHVLHKALEAYFVVLDGYTLEDLVENPFELQALFAITKEK